jgi:hypothetical protein
MKMDDEQFKRIKEAGWRRPLTPDERAALQNALSNDPVERQSWEEELALTSLLDRLPDAPVSSNFTARLMQAVGKEKPARHHWWNWFAPSEWLPERWPARVAMCSMMLCLGVVSFREAQLMHRAKVAQELAGVSRVAKLPRMDWLKDFDTINRISQVKVADDELLAALQ